MTKSPILNFLMGMITGGMLASLILVHIFTNEVVARNAAAASSLEGANAETRKTVDLAQKVIDTWRGRAETCEAKFAVGTIVYQNQPMASFPLLHGIAAFDVAGGSKPSLYIPAQVDIYTNDQSVRYQWFDRRTGAPKGIQFAHSPSEVK